MTSTLPSMRLTVIAKNPVTAMVMCADSLQSDAEHRMDDAETGCDLSSAQCSCQHEAEISPGQSEFRISPAN